MRSKNFTSVLVALCIATFGLVMNPVCGAEGEPPNPPSTLPILDTGADNPIKTSYIWQGFGGVIVEPIAFQNVTVASGTFIVEDLPPGSAIIHAFMAAGEYIYGIGVAHALFNGVPLDTIEATCYDPSHDWDFCYYRWDVTSLISGNGSYPFTCQPFDNCDFVCLVIVYQNLESPHVRIVVNDGIESLESSSSVSLFNGFYQGAGDIKILTMCGDPGGTEEAIQFNDSLLAGPGEIFVQNIGPVADYFEFDLTNIQGDDSLTITTGSDWIGINLAVLTGDPTIDLDLIPYALPVQIPPEGGSFDYLASVSNYLWFMQVMDFWVYVTAPDGSTIGPLLGPSSVSVDPGTTNWYRIQNVDPRVPAGTYTYTGYIGFYPNDVWYSSALEIEKLGSTDDSDLNALKYWCATAGDEFTKSSKLYPDEVNLVMTHPNPFNPATTIRYQLSAASFVNLTVYDVSGRKVAELVTGWRDAGRHEVTFDRSDLASGIYIYQLEAGQFTASGKMVLMK